MTVLIKRNSHIPVKKTKNFTTCFDNQTVIGINVFQGERALTKDCHLLGKFELVGIPPAPAATPQIEVTFDIDANGILYVSARETASGKFKNISITIDQERLSKDAIEIMVLESEKFKKEDDKFLRRIQAKNDLEQYCLQMSSCLKDRNILEHFTPNDKKIIELTSTAALQFVASADKASAEEFRAKHAEV